jgi:uncharacterized cupin superfamily protein
LQAVPLRFSTVVPEAKLKETELGLVPEGEGWFVVNARDVPWRHAEGRGAVCLLEGDVDFKQLGVNPFVLAPGEPMAMYHWEADQEDFLVVSGEAILIADGEERPLRAWDFVHCPPKVNHVIVGAGVGPCVVIAIGAREHEHDPDWGGYSVDETAAKYGASVDEETSEPEQAYSKVTHRQPTRFREEWLPTA